MGEDGSLRSHALKMKTIRSTAENLDTIKPMPATKSLSYISHLECSGCGKEFSYNEIHTYCTYCQSPLLSVYDLEKVCQQVDRDEISRRTKGMWRWSELLPVLRTENQIFLGEGDTPLLTLPQLGRELGLTNLYVKDERATRPGPSKHADSRPPFPKQKNLVYIRSLFQRPAMRVAPRQPMQRVQG